MLINVPRSMALCAARAPALPFLQPGPAPCVSGRPWRRSLRQGLARWGLVGIALLAAMWAIVPPAYAQLQAQLLPQAQVQNGFSGTLERRVKAAFLYKFLGYADFPPGAFLDGSSPVTIGVVGADDLAAELARAVTGRTIHGRPVVVRTLHETDVQLPLHLLFVGGLDAARVGRTVRQASSAMLVVTECEDGLRQGSVINFRMIDERVRFDVSLDAAERNGIKLSSRLLTVANRVQKGVQ